MAGYEDDDRPNCMGRSYFFEGLFNAVRRSGIVIKMSFERSAEGKAY